MLKKKKNGALTISLILHHDVEDRWSLPDFVMKLGKFKKFGFKEPLTETQFKKVLYSLFIQAGAEF